MDSLLEEWVESARRPLRPDAPAGDEAEALEDYDILKSHYEGLAPNWEDLFARGVRVLSIQSKDIVVACWTTVAAFLTRGYPGLAAGFSVIAEYCDGFWDSAWPARIPRRVNYVRSLYGRLNELIPGRPPPGDEVSSAYLFLERLERLNGLLVSRAGVVPPSLDQALMSLRFELEQLPRSVLSTPSEIPTLVEGVGIGAIPGNRNLKNQGLAVGKNPDLATLATPTASGEVEQGQSLQSFAKPSFGHAVYRGQTAGLDGETAVQGEGPENGGSTEPFGREVRELAEAGENRFMGREAFRSSGRASSSSLDPRMPESCAQSQTEPDGRDSFTRSDATGGRSPVDSGVVVERFGADALPAKQRGDITGVAPAVHYAPRPVEGGAEAIRAELHRALSAAHVLAGQLMGFDRQNPYLYVLGRVEMWGAVPCLPEARGGKVAFSGPTREHRQRFKILSEGGNALGLLEAAEEAFALPLYQFWLDLQFWVVKAMGELGDEYRTARDGVVAQLRLFLQRFQGVELLCYQDGTPFACGAVRRWIAADVVSSGDGGVHEKEGAAQDGVRFWQRAVDAARQEIVAGRIEEGLGVFQKEVLRAPHKAARFEGVIELASMCMEAGKSRFALPLLEELDGLAADHDLEQWQPERMKQLLSMYLKCMNRVLQAEKRVLPELLKRRMSLIERLCRFDLAEALALEREIQ